MQVYVQGSLEQDEYEGKSTFQIVVGFGGEILMLDSVREKSEGSVDSTPHIPSDDDIPF
jgi:single-stranded DNA-binding protein